MKELSIEEKEKAYDEAIERAKEINNEQRAQPFNIMIRVFPELKESEGDRILKFISNELACLRATDEKGSDRYEELTKAIDWLEKQGEHDNFINKIQIGDKVTRNEDGVLVNLSQLNRIAKKQGENNIGISETTKRELEDNLNEALEKETPESWNEFIDEQGEQKPADKFETNFKVGDWVVCIGDVQQILSIDANGVCFASGKRVKNKYISNYHLWTIQDAKDGDVLNSMRVQATIIFKGFADDGKHILAYSALQKGIFIKEEMLWDRDFEPCPKNWNDELFSKMHEAGYEWDAEKNELKKIEQKLAWSEEVIATISRAISIVKWAAYSDHSHPILNDKGATELIELLNSLKDRYAWRPSKEQMEQLGWIAKQNKDNMIGKELMSLYQDLKKLMGE